MVKILQGDCIEVLKTLPDESVNCCVTSPPYWGLRDYGVDGQLGLERTPEEYVAKMVEVFREVRRVLRGDGTCWMNLGDAFWSGGKRGSGGVNEWSQAKRSEGQWIEHSVSTQLAIKPKDLVGIPWMVAFALRAPYVNYLIKDQIWRGWVAGLIDGEGCITILKTKSSHSESLSFPPIVQIRMSDTEALNKMVELVGSKLSPDQLSPSSAACNQRPSWQWKVVSERSAQLIAEVYPYLTVKRKQAIVAWNHQNFRSERGNQERKDGELEKERFCKELINKLNQREPVDIPGWMKEPSIKAEPGWYLRQDLIWSKPNCMPESVTDRCTKAHEYIFLMSKSQRYYYDAEAIKEPSSPNTNLRISKCEVERIRSERDAGANTSVGSGRASGKVHDIDGMVKSNNSFENAICLPVENRNKRSVWTVSTSPFPGAHFATFPPKLIEPCILAGCPTGGTVLDPFGGSGTVGMVSENNGRNSILIELNPKYVEMAKRRTAQSGLFT